MIERDIVMTNMRGSSKVFLAEWAILGILYHAKKMSYFLN